MSRKRKVLQGSASNLVRLVLSMLVSLVLPPFLVRRMDHPEYSAWVLILQLSAYVNLLDLGTQTAIGKFVAEFDASGDKEASHGLVSTPFTILAGAAGCLWRRAGDGVDGAEAVSSNAGISYAGSTHRATSRWLLQRLRPAIQYL